MQIRRFAPLSMGLVLLAGCAGQASSERAEAESENVGSATAALTSNGTAQVVSRLESGVAAMAAVVGETGSFQPTSQGIPQRMAAVGAELSAIQTDVAAMAAVNASGSATAAQLQSSAFQLDKLIVLIDQVSNDAKAKLSSINARSESVSIGDMFSMQKLMNSLSQMSEMSTAVVNAANQAILDMARDVKGA